MPPRCPTVSARRLLPGVPLAVVVAVFLLIAGAALTNTALADCEPLTGNNQTIICTGPDTDGLATTFDNATVNVLDGAAIGAAAGDVILFNTSDGSTVNAFGNSSIHSTANVSSGIRVVGDDFTLTLNDNSSIGTTGSGARGLFLTGDNGTITLNDQATISAANAIAISVDGAGNTLTLNNNASISATNATALQFFAGSNTLINHGTISSLNATAIVGATAANDLVFNYGTVSSGTGKAIDLEGGNDQITLGTGSDIHGIIDGGAGSNSVFLTGTGSEDDAFSGFINLTMNGVDWSLSATSNFSNDIIVNQGLLRVNALIFGGSAIIASAGTLGGSGTLASPVISTGTIAPGNSVGMLTIANTFSQTGGAFDIEFDSSGIDLLFVVNNPATLVDFPSVHVTPLHGAAGANGIFLRAESGITGAIGPVDYAGNGAATLVQGANDIRVIAVDGTPLVASNFAALQAGMDYLGVINGAQLAQVSTCLDTACLVTGKRHIWARAFGRFGNEDAQDGNQGFNYRTAGTAFGGDIEVAEGLSLGGSVGYANTDAEVSHDASEADIDGEFAALYANYEIGRFFITGSASGGLQQFDLSRDVAVAGGTDTARAETDGWLAGGSLQAGLKLDFAGGWRLTPSAGIAYQHQSVDGYNEHGAGAGNVDMDDQSSDALRLNAQLNVARTLPYDGFSLVPHIRMGVAEQLNFGDDVDGSFSTGDDFTLAQRDDDRLLGLAGAGMDFVFANGLTANLDYQGQYSTDAGDHAIVAGVALTW